jgi:hypothetical protein
MIRLYLQEKGHFLGREAIAEGNTLLGANVTIVDAYMKRLGPGPSEDDPRFAWERSVSHPWNQMVIRILASNFKTYASTTGVAHLVRLLGAGKGSAAIEDYEAGLDRIADITAVIGAKLADQQRRYRTVTRKIGSLSGLSEPEVKKNLKDNLRTSQTSSRRNERKRNVRHFLNFTSNVQISCYLSDIFEGRQLSVNNWFRLRHHLPKRSYGRF